MKLPRPIRVVPAAGAQDILEERARLLGESGIGVDDLEQERPLIRFRLDGATYAVEMGAVDQVVSRVGVVEEIAGVPALVRGVAFIDNVPHAVMELSHTVGCPPQALSVVAECPALILSRSDGALALTVEGPLEMQEVAGLRLEEKGGSGRRDRLEVAARLDDGALVISTAWLKSFRSALGQGT